MYLLFLRLHYTHSLYIKNFIIDIFKDRQQYKKQYFVYCKYFQKYQLYLRYFKSIFVCPEIQTFQEIYVDRFRDSKRILNIYHNHNKCNYNYRYICCEKYENLKRIK